MADGFMNTDTLARIDEALAAFDGQETSIMAAGRENTKTVVSRYSVEGSERDILIGAARAGGGVWRLIARWIDE